SRLMFKRMCKTSNRMTKRVDVVCKIDHFERSGANPSFSPYDRVRCMEQSPRIYYTEFIEIKEVISWRIGLRVYKQTHHRKVLNWLSNLPEKGLAIHNLQPKSEISYVQNMQRMLIV